MLCTRGIRMANNKMTAFQRLLGFTIFGYILQQGLTINVPVAHELRRDQLALAAHRQHHYLPPTPSAGRSKYEFYEVHNHYLPPNEHHRQHYQHGHQNFVRAPFKEQIRIEHVHATSAPPLPSLPVPIHHPAQHHAEDINVSYLSFAAAEGPNGQQITVSEPVPSSHQQQHHHHHHHQSVSGSGYSYLPPIRQSADFVSDYRPTFQPIVSSQQYFGNNAAQHLATAHHSAAAVHHSAATVHHSTAPGFYNSPGVSYLPPPISQHSHYVSPPPSATIQNVAPIAPVLNEHFHSQHAQIAPSQQYQSFPVTAHYQVADHLPPPPPPPPSAALHASVVSSGSTSYSSAPGYLPPHHHSESSHVSYQPVQSYAPHLPSESQPLEQHQQQPAQALAPSIFTALPPGYEFVKPPNAEEAIAELHSLQNEQKKLQQQTALAQQQQQQQRTTYHQQQLANYPRVPPANHPAPVYLPPTTVESSSAAAQHQQQNQPHEPQMYSLNSYMNSVQPFERYGPPSIASVEEPHKPFAKYGPPAVEHASVQVAPLYSEPAKRPAAYASAMPYKANAVPSDYTTFTISNTASHLNEQTRQTLQALMPKDIQEQYVATAGATGKVRTVQILNSHLVKTLKVLETQDGAGVKTIKILGDSNDNPMGSHQTVHVVSPHKLSAQQEDVQTVKIFNDAADSNVSTIPHNAYLPPAAGEERKQRFVRDSREAHALPLR